LSQHVSGGLPAPCSYVNGKGCNTELKAGYAGGINVDGAHFREPVYRKMNESLLFDHLNITFYDDHVTTIPDVLGCFWNW
jgi:hypothetical protein